MLDLLPEHLKIVKAIVVKFVPDCEVRVFGSRCNGTARKYSDLDLCIRCNEKLDWKVLAHLKDALMESDLPFRVDLLDYYAMLEHFRKNIDNSDVFYP